MKDNITESELDIVRTMNLTPEQIKFILANYKNPNGKFGVAFLSDKIIKGQDEGFDESKLFSKGFRNTDKYQKEYLDKADSDELDTYILFGENLFQFFSFPYIAKGSLPLTAMFVRIPENALKNPSEVLVGEKEKYLNPKYIIGAFKDDKILPNPNYVELHDKSETNDKTDFKKTEIGSFHKIYAMTHEDNLSYETLVERLKLKFEQVFKGKQPRLEENNEFRIDRKKVYEILDKARSGKISKEEAGKELEEALGGDNIDEIFESYTRPNIIREMLEEGKIHYSFLGDGLQELEDLINKRPSGQLSDFYSVRASYILSLSKEAKEKLAESFSREDENLKETLVKLWNLGISTSGGIRNREYDKKENGPVIFIEIPLDHPKFKEYLNYFQEATADMKNCEIAISGYSKEDREFFRLEINSSNLYEVLKDFEFTPKAIPKINGDFLQDLRDRVTSLKDTVAKSEKRLREKREKQEVMRKNQARVQEKIDDFQSLVESFQGNSSMDTETSNKIQKALAKSKTGVILSIDITDIASLMQLKKFCVDNGVSLEEVEIMRKIDLDFYERANQNFGVSIKGPENIKLGKISSSDFFAVSVEKSKKDSEKGNSSDDKESKIDIVELCKKAYFRRAGIQLGLEDEIKLEEAELKRDSKSLRILEKVLNGLNPNSDDLELSKEGLNKEPSDRGEH